MTAHNAIFRNRIFCLLYDSIISKRNKMVNESQLNGMNSSAFESPANNSSVNSPCYFYHLLSVMNKKQLHIT